MNSNASSFVACAIAFSAVAVFASATAATFGVARVALRFGNEKPAVIVERDDKLAAQAEISFTGNGLLRAAWEIAGPNPDANRPRFRILTDVQQPLGGRDAAILTSPRLPTNSTGLYLVRLRIVEPATTLETPVIRYNVNEKKASQEQS